ncbi:MAG: hypothetical protein AAGI44_10140, partial [Pseudomonadota bacterium]
FPSLATVIIMSGGYTAIDYSTFRSGYELLYTPVLPRKKRPTKTIIDVGGEMTGTLAGGALAFAVVAVTPANANAILLIVGVLTGILGLRVVQRVRSGYVESLAESLEVDEQDFTNEANNQVTPRAPLGDLIARLDRQYTRTPSIDEQQGSQRQDSEVISAIQSIRSRYSGTSTDTRTSRVRQADQPQREPASAQLSLHHILQALLSNDKAVCEVALRNHSPLPPELVPSVISLLALDDRWQAAYKALQVVVPRNTGALLDALQQQTNSVAVQARICNLLTLAPTPRIAGGLTLTLSAQSISTRVLAANALLSVRRKNALLVISNKAVFDAVLTEARAIRHLWLATTAIDAQVSKREPIDTPQGKRVLLGITYISTLLLCVLDDKSTSQALRSLAHAAPALRGVGLEYLENVLPLRLHAQLKPLVEDTKLALGTVRARSSIIEEMLRDMETAQYDLPTLRQTKTAD